MIQRLSCWLCLPRVDKQLPVHWGRELKPADKVRRCPAVTSGGVTSRPYLPCRSIPRRIGVEYKLKDLNSTHQKGISRRKTQKGRGRRGKGCKRQRAAGRMGRRDQGQKADLTWLQGCSARHPARCALAAHCLLLDHSWESSRALRLSWME